MKLFFNCGVIMAMFSFLFGCSSLGRPSPDYEKIAAGITEKTAKKLKEQKNLLLVGTGGQMMGDIQAMDMSFYYYQEIDLNTARELVVSAINEYLLDINNNTEIRPYLHEYPFTAKNVEIRIFIYKPDGFHPPLDRIQCISSINGILTYYLNAPEKYSYEPLCEETYEEALKLVNNESGL